MSSIVFELYKLGEPVGEEEQDYEMHNKKFVIMLCEKKILMNNVRMNV